MIHWDFEDYIESPQYEADKEKSRHLTLKILVIGMILAMIWLVCNLQ